LVLKEPCGRERFYSLAGASELCASARGSCIVVLYVKTITYSGDWKERKGKNTLFPLFVVSYLRQEMISQKAQKEGSMSRKRSL